MGEGGSIGTIFAEIDLDRTRYLKSQQQLYKDATTTSLSIEQNFKNLGIKTDAVFDLMRAKIENSYNAIKHSAQATANDIVRAETAKNAKLEELNRQQFGSHDSMLSKIKSNYIAASVAVTAAIIAIKKAWDFVEWGAKSIQAEESFRRVAFSAGENADKILAAMKKATVGTIDDSELMQKAVKGITQGLKGEDLIAISEAARVASRALGIEVSEAFNMIVDSVANKTPRALKQMGLITTEQMTLFSKAVNSGAENVNLLDIVTANTLKHHEMFGTFVVDNTEKMRSFSVVTKNAAEEVAKFFSKTFTEAWNNMEKTRIRNEQVASYLGRPAKSKAEYEETVQLLFAMGDAGDYAQRHLQAGETKIKTTMQTWKEAIDKAQLEIKLKSIGESWKTTLQDMTKDIQTSGFSDKFQKEIEEIHIKAKERIEKYKGISGARIKIVKWEESEVARIQQASRFHDLDEVRKGNLEKQKESEAMLKKFFADEEALKEKRIKEAHETSRELMRISHETLEAVRADEEYHQQLRVQQNQTFMDFMNKGGTDTGKLGQELGNINAITQRDDQYTQEIERANQHYNDMVAMNQGYWNAVTLNAEAAAQRDTQIKQAERNRSLSLYSSQMGAMSSMLMVVYNQTGQHNEKLFKAAKAFAIAQALINTYQAATKALSQGGWFGIVMMIATLAAGMAQVQNIRSQQPEGGGGAASVSGGGGGNYNFESASTPVYTAETKKEEKVQPPIINNYYVYGDVVDLDPFARKLVPALAKAYEDQVH